MFTETHVGLIDGSASACRGAYACHSEDGLWRLECGCAVSCCGNSYVLISLPKCCVTDAAYERYAASACHMSGLMGVAAFPLPPPHPRLERVLISKINSLFVIFLLRGPQVLTHN
jgi:hypothetical protein